MSVRSTSLFLAAAISACLAAPGAYAQPTSVQEIVVQGRHGSADAETRSQTVSYADLDLGREAGARALLKRISGAAKQVCSPEPRDLADTKPYQACTQQAADRAVATVDSPKVSALYHNGH